jgi:hypothetical protein
MPGWFPDGADSEKGACQRLFQEEVIGIEDGVPVPFGVRFNHRETAAKDADSSRWILGSRIARVKNPKEKSLTNLVRRLAVKVRQYNASLYQLRRLHFCYKYPDNWPDPNPHGDHPGPPPGSPAIFRQRVKEAEADWSRVTNQVNKFLESGHSNFGLKLLAADMIAVNGYIVSMRVVAQKPTRGRRPVFEVGGSSSHVSISSPFSSSSQAPAASSSSMTFNR